MRTQTFDKSPSLRVWRDSVHPRDDSDAPHEIQFSIDPHESLESVTGRLLEAGYLPGIAGGKATWILESGTHALAVIAQQWPYPCFLVSPSVPAVSCIRDKGGWHLHFRYWCQADPALVFRCLRDGKPLPSKYD
jgi:hypothetical protein